MAYIKDLKVGTIFCVPGYVNPFERARRLPGVSNVFPAWILTSSGRRIGKFYFNDRYVIL